MQIPTTSEKNLRALLQRLNECSQYEAIKELKEENARLKEDLHYMKGKNTEWYGALTVAIEEVEQLKVENARLTKVAEALKSDPCKSCLNLIFQDGYKCIDCDIHPKPTKWEPIEEGITT